ncbi:MAG: hypothetical protein IJQ67_00700 [Bacilli bacterium]|nr:hypothetical protein [Methanobrevibacter sp.]MBQ6629753.1 hypothetical protein [Methanobrevibacter sp.]MBR0294409.1 hypothetical protein [Bacilli bacterium]
MKKQWEDWIIFLGFDGDQYDNTMSVIKMWNGLLTESGLNKKNLEQLTKWLFYSTYSRIWHSCCLSFESMHVDNGYVIAHWIDGGGLTDLPKEYDKVKDKEFSDFYDDYRIKNLPLHFFNNCDYQVIGMTLDGKIVMDTFEKYGHKEDIRRRMQELGESNYCKEFLETIKENYQKLRLPDVPKGILKIPTSI